MAAGALAVRRIAKRTDPQMILSLYGGMQATSAWLSGIRPYSVYIVGSDVLLADRMRSFITRRALRASNHVFANGQNLRDKTQVVVPGTPVEMLLLGIDLRRFRPVRSDRRQRQSLRFVCSRSFNPVYDNATIVRAFASIASPPPELSLEFLSSGPLLEETEKLAAELFASSTVDTVRFARGASDDAFLAALQGSTYYISASLSDGASASLLEAMACGLFPIASDIPANREWISHGRNGLLFEPGNDESLRKCVEAAIAGIPWMHDAIAENFTQVSELADFDKNLQRLVALLGLESAPGAALEILRCSQ
jgi:glycosyltransferase involved in cell wall biosynthesis